MNINWENLYSEVHTYRVITLYGNIVLYIEYMTIVLVETKKPYNFQNDIEII